MIFPFPLSLAPLTFKVDENATGTGKLIVAVTSALSVLVLEFSFPLNPSLAGLLAQN